MRVAEMHYTDISSGALETNDFSVEVDSVLMRQMISQIAKNKIEYPVREVCSNAWDTHAPFTVDLPTTWTPVFRVRDTGPGLSHDEIMTVYTRIGKSLKRDTDTKVGSKGWGSKSPFAYLTSTGDGSAAFNVVSRHGGKARHYIMAMSESGMPQARFMFDEDTTETGLEVSFPVRKDDIWRFHDAAKKILWFFPPRPTITPEDFELAPEADSVVKSGKNWTLHKSSAPISGPHVRMGCVGYPIDFAMIGLHDWPWMDDNIVFETEVGSVELQTSREALSYDDKTKQTLLDLIADFEFQFVDQVRDILDSEPTYIKACAKLWELSQTFGRKHVDYVAQKLRYRGRITPDHELKISSSYGKCMVFTVQEDFTSGLTFRDQPKYGYHKFDASNFADAMVIVERKPSRSLLKIEYLRNIGQLPVGTKVIWLRPSDDIGETMMLNALDLSIGEVIKLDPIKPTFVPQKRTIDKTLTRVSVLMTRGVVTERLDLSIPGYFVIDEGGRTNRRNRFYYTNPQKRAASYSIISFKKQLRDLGIVLDQPILVLKNGEPVPQGWVFFGEAVEQAIDKVINWRQVRRHIAVGADICGMLRSLTKPAKEKGIELDLTTVPADLASLITRAKKHQEGRAKIKIPERTIQLWDIRRQLAVNPAPVDASAEQQIVEAFDNEMDSLSKRLPLLETLIDDCKSYWGAPDKEKVALLQHYLNLELIASTVKA